MFYGNRANIVEQLLSVQLNEQMWFECARAECVKEWWCVKGRRNTVGQYHADRIRGETGHYTLPRKDDYREYRRSSESMAMFLGLPFSVICPSKPILEHCASADEPWDLKSLASAHWHGTENFGSLCRDVFHLIPQLEYCPANDTWISTHDRIQRA